jgi:hypothetical protein
VKVHQKRQVNLDPEQTEHRLYLFGGETFIVVPESTWLNELKSNPTGPTVINTIEDSLITKGWIKLLGVQNPANHAWTSEWFFEETGTHMRVLVDEKGQLTVDGAPVGPTTMGETMKILQKLAEEKTGRWVTAVQEVKAPDGLTVMAKRRFFIPAEKLRRPEGLEPGKGAKEPSEITRVAPEKGGPHPTADVLSMADKTDSWTTMAQSLGLYGPPVLKENPTPEEMIRQCNALLELAEKEENEAERERLCKEVEKTLLSLEAMSKSLKTHLQHHDIPEELHDSKHYKDLAGRAENPEHKKKLLEISGDEAGHNKDLKQIVSELPK